MHVKHLTCCPMHNEYPSIVVLTFSSPVTKYVILDKLTFLFLKNLLFILAAKTLHCGTWASLVAAHWLRCSTWDLNSLTRDQTWAHCIGSVVSYPLG